MSAKIFIFLIFLLVNISYVLGNACNSKKIVITENNGYSLVEGDTDYLLNSDYKKAFNKYASCGSLITDNIDSTICCYMKVKYKFDPTKTHFTRKGCVEVSLTDLQTSDNFTSMRKGYEEGIKNYYSTIPNSTVSDVDVDIDCNSKFIKLTALVFLMILL